MASPVFKLKNLGELNLKNVEIVDVSDSSKLGYGRRFVLKTDDAESKHLIFKKIFRKVETLSHSTGENSDRLDELEALQGFITKLRTANDQANITYNQRSHWYKFRTWFHRLFSSGFKVEKVDALESDVQARIAEYHNKQSRLYDAVKLGDIDALKLFLADSIDLNFREPDGFSPLMQAVIKGQSQMVEMLIEGGADVDFPDTFGRTAIHFASMRGKEEILNVLLKRSADIDIQDKEGKAAVHYAAIKGNKEVFAALLENNANINLRDKNGQTAVHYLIPSGDVETLKLLVEHNADIDIQDKVGRTAAHYASMTGKKALLEGLIGSHANINLRDKGGQTAEQLAWLPHIILVFFDLKKQKEHLAHLKMMELFDAVKSGDFKTVEGFLETGINLNVRDDQGKTPLIHAIIQNHIEIVEALIAAGADVDLVDSRGNTPLMNVNVESTFIDELLLDHGANPNAQDSQGNTILHKALAKGDTERVYLILRNGADLNIRNKIGRTPLHIALNKGNADCARLLILLSVGINIEDNAGCTPLHLAVDRGDADIVRLLLTNLRIYLNVQTINEGITPLHIAVTKGDTEITQLLIRRRANLNVRKSNGYTALQLAVQKGIFAYVKLLIEGGADLNVRNDDGYTAFQMAIELDNKSISKAIKSKMHQSEIILQKEALRMNVLAHSIHLGGTGRVQLTGKKSFSNVKLEGSLEAFMVKNMIKATRELVELKPEVIKKDELSELIDLLDSGRDHSNEFYQERLEKGLPCIFLTGFNKHRAVVVVWGPYFILCNRGMAMRKPVEVFKYDQKLLDASIINKIKEVNLKDENSYRELFFNELPNLLGFLPQSQTEKAIERICADSLYIQNNGNCGWAAPEASVFVFYAFKNLLINDEPILNISEEQAAAIKKKFFSWLSFAQVYNLERYLGSHVFRSSENSEKVAQHLEERKVTVLNQGFIQAVKPLIDATARKGLPFTIPVSGGRAGAGGL